MESATENGAAATVPDVVPKEEPASGDTSTTPASEGDTPAANAAGDAVKSEDNSAAPPAKEAEGGGETAATGSDAAAADAKPTDSNAEGGGDADTAKADGDTKLLKELDDEAPKTFPQVVRAVVLKKLARFSLVTYPSRTLM